MTTIAYRDGIIAYDSRATAGDTVVWDDYEKCIERQGVRFFICGSNSGIEHLIDAYFGEQRTHVNCNALVWDGSTIHHVSHENESDWARSPVPLHMPYAIGSGRDHAFTAMDMGASAEVAIEMTKKRDLHTGGTVRTFHLPKEEGGK